MQQKKVIIMPKFNGKNTMASIRKFNGKISGLLFIIIDCGVGELAVYMMFFSSASFSRSDHKNDKGVLTDNDIGDRLQYGDTGIVPIG